MSKITSYNVLLIDDHPLITEAYQSALFYISSLDNSIEFKVINAYNCDEAFENINAASQRKKGFDFIFLDISLPPSIEHNILSGEDLGLLIRARLPKSKIIVVTSFSDSLRIQNILKNLKPEGFLIKNDLTPKELVNALEIIMANKSYYSETVMQVLCKQLASGIKLDKLDRQILYELSLGTRMKELSAMLPLSLTAIEKRKQRLLEVFEIEARSDRDLVLKAKEKGFL